MRRTVRDLAALSMMPSIWVDCDLRRSLQNLVDVLRAALRAVTVCIRVELPDGTRFEGEAARSLATSGRCSPEVQDLLNQICNSDPVARVAQLNGDGLLNALPHAIYSEGRRIGTFVAC
ncbi:MAG TPA: hypothetical protein VJ063_20625, partial [Verrucomicrobiae bacterium]|nr:hypothetical protein [Verrucomicrobiae bacterium]